MQLKTNFTDHNNAACVLRPSCWGWSFTPRFSVNAPAPVCKQWKNRQKESELVNRRPDSNKAVEHAQWCCPLACFLSNNQASNDFPSWERFSNHNEQGSGLWALAHRVLGPRGEHHSKMCQQRHHRSHQGHLQMFQCVDGNKFCKVLMLRISQWQKPWVHFGSKNSRGVSHSWLQTSRRLLRGPVMNGTEWKTKRSFWGS